MAGSIVQKPPRKGFTPVYVKGLKPQAERYEISDPGAPGLRLRVTPRGVKTWVWMRRVGKQIRRVTIGNFPAIDVYEARRQLLDLQERHRNGDLDAPPADAPKTVGELLDVFYKDRIVPHRRRPDSVKQVIDSDDLQGIASKKLATVQTTTLSAAVQQAVKRGSRAQGGKVLSVIKQAFGFAQARGFRADNPAASLKSKDLGILIGERDRTLSDDEIAFFWHELDNTRLQPAIRTGLKLLLVLGIRSGELRLAEWKHVDLDRGELFIPKTHRKHHRKDKAAKDWRVPLPPLALDLLKQLPQRGRYVLEARTGGALGEKAIPKALQRVVERWDIEPFVAHDLRRTMRTNLSQLGVAVPVAEFAVGHTLGGVLAIYDRHDYRDEHRDALERWAAKLERIVGLAADNVIEMGARA